MSDLNKIDSSRFFAFWKNFSVALLVMIITLFLSMVLPFYFSPIVSLLGAAFLYTQLYNNKLSKSAACMLCTYSIFLCLISFSFISILLNVLYIWGFINLPKEFSFFAEPYIPSLILNPICFLIILILKLRSGRLSICVDCRIEHGPSISRGRAGQIHYTESRLQLNNLLWLFGILTLLTWCYYLFFYMDININARDNYIFFWVNIIAFVIDEIYFASRYYNMYLDLKENGEIITEDELGDMTTKTYLRYYVVCGNSIYINPNVADPYRPDAKIIDTHFVTKRNVNGITTVEVNDIIRRMLGMQIGKLRFFYGRKSPDHAKHSLLRYFYFLPGEPEDYPEMRLAGKWMDFSELMGLYNTNPNSISRIFLSDISRMTTIVLTQKIFNEEGVRRIKTKSYRPTYDLVEIQKKDYDFQDDKWIRISMFNSDTKAFFLRKWFRNLMRINKKNSGDKWLTRR